MARIWCWCAVSLVLGLAVPAAAGTVLEKRVRHTILPDGSVMQETSLEVRLDSLDDVQKWSPYYVYLDDHRRLDEVVAFATRPDGTKVKAKAGHRDRIEVAQEGVLHGSRAFLELPFPYLPVGSVLSIRHRVREEPYFPSGRIVLAEDDPIEELSVEVSGGSGAWRWQVEGAPELVDARGAEGAVAVSAAGLADHDALDERGEPPVLRYAWGPEGTWRTVAGWYQGLLRDLPPLSEAERARARELVAGVDDPRQRLEAILAFLRHEIRYVAVEVGIGGYRPSPPRDVLERKWGDCKDKTALFLGLLEEAGIEGYPVLVRSSLDDDVNRDFPSPDDFNHVIAAVPADAVAVDDQDPVAGGLLFVDPTQEAGGARWLHPGVQRKGALVVRGAASALVETPARAGDESEQLELEVRVSRGGHAEGRAELVVRGRLASRLLGELASPRAERSLRGFFARRLPGLDFLELAWQEEPGGVPTVRLSADVRAIDLVATSGSRPSFRLPALPTTPSPSELGDAASPVTLQPRVSHARWRIALPSGWCPPEVEPVMVDNQVGAFQQAVSLEGDTLVIERRVELDVRDVEGEAAMAALKELCLGEHRALRRRLRLGCAG